METFEDFLNSEELSKLKEKYSDFDNYISQDELEMIFQGMDRTDFTQAGVSRWRDLDKIVHTVFSKKKYSPNYKLKKIVLVEQQEIWPPINYYHYDFK